MQKEKVIVICGPTASGKTKLSIELAKKINGEIISCDSMQIYKDMTIGTAKPTVEEMDGVPHHLIDFVLPSERYSVADFKKAATKKIEEILGRNKTPIIVGGTGLYVDSLVNGVEYDDIKIDLEYRTKLEDLAKKQGLEFVYDKAMQIDPEAMKKISKNDKKRIFRVLEIYNATGKTKTEQEIESRKKENPYNFKVFGINMEREKLYERINLRVDIMMKQGLVQEVDNIVKKYKGFPTAMQALGYKEVIEYLKGEVNEEGMVERIKRESRRYAKRQITWFKRNENIIWLDGLNDRQNNIKIILEGIK